jgi:hypothetical protein
VSTGPGDVPGLRERGGQRRVQRAIEDRVARLIVEVGHEKPIALGEGNRRLRDKPGEPIAQPFDAECEDQDQPRGKRQSRGDSSRQRGPAR